MKKIAYLGPVGTFTHAASIKYFSCNDEFLPCKTIKEVFKSVIDGETEFGVVPAENSTGGSIVDTLDLFIKTSVKIFDQVTLEIKQNLLSKSTNTHINKIYSHPQSFLQCSGYLLKNFPAAELIEMSSNSSAAIAVSKEENAASIGPDICAMEYGLEIIEEQINDFAHNETRFFVISNNMNPDIKERAMIIFSVPDKAGALFEVLKIFKKEKINMTRIESRPSRIKKWHYVFIIEYELFDFKQSTRLLEKLKKLCLYFNYLGSY